MLDGLGMGIGFTLAITILAAVREILGHGSFFGIQLYPASSAMTIAGQAPGGFILLGILLALVNLVTNAATRKKAGEATQGEGKA